MIRKMMKSTARGARRGAARFSFSQKSFLQKYYYEFISASDFQGRQEKRGDFCYNNAKKGFTCYAFCYNLRRKQGSPALAVLNLSLATSAGECAEAILLLFPRRGRMCASCRQPRCGFCAHMSLAILHLQRKIADRSTSIHLCEKAPSNSEDFLPSVREKISE